MLDASKLPLGVPAHVRLRDGDEPFWHGVIAARARDEWTECDLVVAAQLARCQRDMEDQSKLLEIEDMTVLNQRGTVVVNARVTVMQQLAQREMALMRTLRMGGEPAGKTRDRVQARKIERESSKLREELAEEDLLAS